MGSLTTAAPVRNAVVVLYGAVAALIRRDRDAVRLMLDDLQGGLESVDDVLLTISLATLERLHAAAAAQHVFGVDQGLRAGDLLATAAAFDVGSLTAIHAAAWRLDAVRRADPCRPGRGGLDDRELIEGAASLLAAVVTAGATQIGSTPRAAVTELCAAAALAAHC